MGSRRWELRVQGKFRKKPTGILYAGVVLQDFDHSVPQSIFGRWLSTLSIAPLEHVVGASLHFTFGDRGETAARPDAEYGCLVGELAVFDQIIVTPPGETCPDICGNLDNVGLRRSAERNWADSTRLVADEVDTEHTYTFCFWGASRFI